MDFKENNSNADDEISFYDLYRVIVKRFKLLIGVALTVFIAVAIYLLMAPKVYQSNVILLAPSDLDVSLTNIDLSVLFSKQTSRSVTTENKGINEEITPSGSDVFKQYQGLLASGMEWQKFRSNSSSDAKAGLQKIPAANPFTVNSSDSDKATLVYASRSQQNVTSLISDYLQYCQDTLKRKLSGGLGTVLSKYKKTLEIELNAARLFENQEALRRSEKLKQEVAQAKKLGVLNNLRINIDERANKFISVKSHRLALLNQVQISSAGFRAYRLADQISGTPQLVRPRTRLTIILGILFGVFLGFVVVFVVEFISTARNYEK